MPKLAVVIKEQCNPQGCGGYLCIRVCPVNRMGKEHIVVDPVDKKVRINPELTSSACSIEAKRCPFDAIHLLNVPEELAKQPIHQYGINGFHLYNLPMPVFGKVVGVLGRNGIGKSTAVKVLAGVLRPNLGKEKMATKEELAEYFKGTEAQVFFEKLAREEIIPAYKPQQVDIIQRSTKGRVRDLLEKVDEKNKLDEVSHALHIDTILDNDISKVSGGEMQRVAIAATALKKANLYVFDEPTSYLDVKQRMIVAKFIRGLADENTAVLVVEHDLLLLDYLADLAHIFFGEENCYGIVSVPKPVRGSINSYLEGYIKEQNMRFREYPLSFLSRQKIGRRPEEITLASWTELVVSLGKFRLAVRPGRIEKHSVVGVLGENGIGKTTFVKILAGVIKPQRGQTTAEVKVSYKPQYLESESEELVANFIKEAVEKYEVQLIRPLNLKNLLTKQLRHLSGGELQRVAVAKCLSQDVDLYLLDEPSAYLDSEQRLAVAKTIREVAEARGVSCLVVDHDLMFVDYLSDELIVFHGKPAVQGIADGPHALEDGMNHFLKHLDITLRKDPESKRPRINKPGSRLDREQKAEGKLYAA